MKIMMSSTMLIFCLMICGCQEKNISKAPDERVMNSKLINTYNNIAIQNAIISEHTLFPYHFIKNSAELNELGKRDLAILTKHLAENGGHLDIRQVETSAELYEARVSLVRNILRDAGVDMTKVSISDGMPGGSGMPSEKIQTIPEKKSTSESSSSRISTMY